MALQQQNFLFSLQIIKMLPKVNSFIVLVLLATTLTTDARRSRIDLPIANADEAPASDNVATASGTEEVKIPVAAPLEFVSQASVPAPASVATSSAEAPAQADTDSLTAVGEIEEECDPDMIGFEIVTG